MQTKKILIVEDELSIADFIAEVFHMLGHKTRILTTGKKVAATSKEWKPDLARKMPGESCRVFFILV